MHFLLMLVIVILDIVAVLEILKSRDEGQKKAIWIIIIACLPVLGLALWYFLGRKEG